MKKNRPSLKKPRRSKSSQNRLQRKQQRSQSSSEFDYQNLEPRYALDASFVYDDANGLLDLSAFASDVTFTNSGGNFTAELASGVWTGEDPTDDVNDINFGGTTLTLRSNFLSTVNVVTLGNNTLTFANSTFNAGQSVSINSNSNFAVIQTGSLNLNTLSVTGRGSFDLRDPGNRLGTLNVDVTGDASVFSGTSLNGNIFDGSSSVRITVTNPISDPSITYNEINSLGNTTIYVDGDVNVATKITGPGGISIMTGQDVVTGDIGDTRTNFVDVNAASITAANVRTTYTSVADDINNVGKTPATSIRLRATDGTPVIGVPGSDTPLLRDNSSGGITISGAVQADQILLQSSNGIVIPINQLDTLYLYLGGDLEAESRGEFQLNVPSLQQLSVNLYDGFAITSQQDLTIGGFDYTGVDDGDPTTTFDTFDDQVFTVAYSDLYANVSAKSLIFDAPFSTQKLVADITTDVEQNAGAALEIHDLYVSAKRVVLDNTDNDFQRIAAVGKGFLADDRLNNEDILTIRDQGTLEIAVLDNQPDDMRVVYLNTPIAVETLAGISIAGQVDIQTGHGGPAPIQPVNAVAPTSEQLGNTSDNPNQYQIEKFEIPRDRAGTQTGVFRDDNYNGAVRPVYYIEFVYDGTQDLTIRTDEFERGNPERVRNFIDIELALYNDLGQVVALGDDIARELDEITFAAGTLAPGRYFVAASAFSTEFEDDFVVKTANTQTGTLNITITGNAAVTPETSRDLTQAVGAPLIVLGGDEPISDADLFEENPADFTPDKLVQLDPDADDFAPERRRRNPIGDPLPEVDGRATLSAANGGSVKLGQVDSNDVRELVVSEAETVEFTDTNNLLVSNLDTPDQTRLAAGRGGAGQLTVGDIAAPKLLLQASSGVTQKGVLTTDTLLLGGDSAIDGGGDFVILSDTLENLAFNLPAGSLALTTSQELNLVFEQYSDPENLLAPRFIFNQSMVGEKARIEAASINVNTRVVAETLVLSVDDSIVQAAEITVPPNFDPDLIPSIPSIATDSLSVSATTVTLDQSQNEITRFAGNITGTGDALNLVNRTPIVFATIDNTIETVTRLRPIGVTQVFGPLMTINGLTVAGMADIITGIEPDDPTANPNAIVTINPVVVSDDDGSNTANFFGNEVQEAEIKRLIDVIYLQAGIDVEWLPTQSWNNSFANIGDGTTGDDGERPRGDLFTIVTNGDAVGVGSPDPNVIDLYAVRITPGNPPAIGLGFLGFPGTTIQVDDGAPATANGRALTAFLAAHEIGHNLGLGHVEGTPDNLMNPFVRATPPPTLNAEQAAIALASPLSSEPAGVRGGFTQEDDAPINIGTANFTVRADGDIVLLNPANDVNFVGTDARDVSVGLVDGSVVTSITANRNLSIEGAGGLDVIDANALDGNATINAADDILIGQVTADGTAPANGNVFVTSTSGSINDLQDDLVADIDASGTVTLTAANDIGGSTPAGTATDADGRLELADRSVLVATATTGDIALSGLGQITLEDVSTTAGAIDLTAAGVLVGNVNSGSTIAVDSTGNIDDLQDDLVADFTASGLVTLNATGSIGGGATPTVVDAAGQLEFGDGTLVSTQTTGGGVVIGGDGSLTFVDIKTPDDLKISSTGDLTIRNVMALSAMLTAVKDVTINSVMTVNETMITAGMNLDVEDVMASEATLTAGGILDVVTVTATTGDATLTSGGNIITGTVEATNGNIVLDSEADLTATSLNGQTATVTAEGTANIDTIDTDGATGVTVVGDATLGTVTADSADLSSGAILTAINVTTVGDATLTASDGTLLGTENILVGSINAGGDIVLQADDNVFDLEDDLLVDLTAGGTITLNAGVGVGGDSPAGLATDAEGRIELADGAVINSDAGTGDLLLRGVGDLTLGDVTANSIVVEAAEDILIGSVTATTLVSTDAPITIVSTGGSINDLQDDELVDLTTGTVGVITLIADDEVGGNVAAGSTNDSSGKIELAVDTNLDARSTAGDISVHAAGEITLQDVEAIAGAVDVTAASDVNVDTVAAGTTIDITTTGGNINDLLFDADDIDLTAGGLITLTADGEIGGTLPLSGLDLADGSVVDATSTANSVGLEGLGDITLRNVNAFDVARVSVTGNVTLDSVVAGNTIDADATGDILLGSLDSGDTIDIDAGGSILDAQDDNALDVTAAGVISLDAMTIGGNSPAGLVTDADGRIEFADGSTVDVSSSNGTVALHGVGELVLDDVSSSIGSVDITSVGDILVGNVSSDIDVSILSGGSINDLQDDTIDDFAAGGVITLTAAGSVGGGATPQVVDTGGALEVPRNTSISILTTGGDIDINGSGPLTFLDLKTPSSITIDTGFDLTVRNIMADDATINAAGDVTINSVMTVNDTFISSNSDVDIEEIMAATATVTTDGILDLASITTTGDATLTSVGNLIAGTVTSTNGTSIIDTDADLNITNILGQATTITVDGVTAISNIDVSALVMLTSVGNATLMDVKAGSAGLISQATLNTGTVATTGNANLYAGTNINAPTVTATNGNANLTAGVDINSALITARSAALNAGGSINTTNVVATAGSASLVAGLAITAQTVTAPGNATLRTTTGNIVVDTVTSDNAAATINSGADLTAGQVTGDTAALISNGIMDIDDVETVGASQLTSGSLLTVDSVNSSTTSISSVGNMTATDVTATNGTATLASQGTLTSGTVAAELAASLTATGDLTSTSVVSNTGLANLQSGAVLTSGSVTGADATLAAGTSLNAGNVVSTVGDINMSALNDITAAMVMAQNNANLTATGSIVTTQDVITKTGIATLVSGAGVNVAGIDVIGLSIDAFEDILIGDLTVVNIVDLASRGKIETGDLSASAVTLDAGTSLSNGNVTATTGDVSLTSIESMVTGTVTADDGDITIVSGNELESEALAANNVTVTTSDNARIASVTASAAATLNSGGVLNVNTVDAQTASLTAAENVTVTNVNTIGDATLNAGDGNLTGDQVVSTMGAISLSSLQKVNVGEAVASGDVTLEAGNSVNTNRVVSETGSATVNANGNLSAKVVEAAVDAILIAPRSDVYSDSVIAGGSAQLTSGAYMFTRNVEAPNVTMTAGSNQVARRVIADTAEITAVRDLGVNDIQVGQLTLGAGDDIYDAQWLDGKRVTTDSLVINAGNSINEGTFGGIVLETDVNTLSATIEGDSFGNLIIREADGVTLGDINVGNGRINITAGGTISGGNLRTRVQNDRNDIRLIATGDASDIRVDSIDVGNVGDAFLIADDDVVITGAGKQVKADYVFVSAKNRSVGSTDGIALSTDIKTADLVVGDKADATQNRGDISITDANALNVNFARTLNGKVSATANGNLVTTNIQSEGVNEADAISLTAIGSGADVVTSRVAVRQQTGGVVLTADDDIRDDNPKDGLLVVADNLTMVAGNNLNDTFNGINSQSRVKSIDATVNSTPIPDGEQEGLRETTISIVNTGQLRLNQANMNSGLVRVINNNGFLTIADVNLTSTSTDNRVFAKTNGNKSDIAVGNINAGQRGTVLLDSADDIFDTEFLDDLFVEGGFLSATSRNGNVDTFDGIILNVDVDNFVADAQEDGEEVVRQRG